MLHTVAAVVFLAGHALGRREHIQVHSASTGWEIPGEEFEETIAKIWATFVKRAAIVREQTSKAYTPAESMLSLFNAVERRSEYKEAPCNGAGKVTKEGFEQMYTLASAWEKFVPTPQFKQSFDELFALISINDGKCVDKHVATNMLSARHMSDQRVAVLKDVFESVTGSVGTAMKVGDMPCKAADMQKWFFYCMHGDCDEKNPAPVDFNTFKLYYNGLGMFISSDDQFELMLVNAWHMMGDRSFGGTYEDINTVNLVMRCYEENQDTEGEGTRVVLNPDCPSPRSNQDVATAMARKQKGKAFKKGCFF